MKKNIITNKTKGFTIVELLVVIVVIGILAAISIVSYTGVTKKAKDSTAATAADNLLSAAEIYNATNDVYPTVRADLIGNSAAGITSSISEDALLATGNTPASATTPSKVAYYPCYTNSQSAIITAVTTANGARIGYYSSTVAASPYMLYLYAGRASSASIANNSTSGTVNLKTFCLASNI